MSAETAWRPVASYGALFEAELPRQHLENAEIPVLLKGVEAGIWGPGFAGPTSRGITLLVPEDRLEEARELLGEGAV
jgi:hypothetical protein